MLRSNGRRRRGGGGALAALAAAHVAHVALVPFDPLVALDASPAPVRRAARGPTPTPTPNPYPLTPNPSPLTPSRCAKLGEAAITAVIGAYGVVYCVAHWLTKPGHGISPAEIAAEFESGRPRVCEGACAP